jgi:hypothetical protein
VPEDNTSSGEGRAGSRTPLSQPIRRRLPCGAHTLPLKRRPIRSASESPIRKGREGRSGGKPEEGVPKAFGMGRDRRKRSSLGLWTDIRGHRLESPEAEQPDARPTALGTTATTPAAYSTPEPAHHPPGCVDERFVRWAGGRPLVGRYGGPHFENKGVVSIWVAIAPFDAIPDDDFEENYGGKTRNPSTPSPPTSASGTTMVISPIRTLPSKDPCRLSH